MTTLRTRFYRMLAGDTGTASFTFETAGCDPDVLREMWSGDNPPTCKFGRRFGYDPDDPRRWLIQGLTRRFPACTPRDELRDPPPVYAAPWDTPPHLVRGWLGTWSLGLGCAPEWVAEPVTATGHALYHHEWHLGWARSGNLFVDAEGRVLDPLTLPPPVLGDLIELVDWGPLGAVTESARSWSDEVVFGRALRRDIIASLLP